MKHLRYRPDIDGLRAVAIVLVVAFHALPSTLPGGFIGVDVFFVISGYLIGSVLLQSLRDGSFSIASFYARRVKRIFPPLAVVLIAGFLIALALLMPDELVQLAKEIIASAAFVANLSTWHDSGYFDKAAETKPFLHLWSLGVEEQFYLAWPLLLLALSRRPRLQLPVLGVSALGSFALSAYLVSVDRTAAFYSPLSRYWELAAGTLLALSMRANPPRPARVLQHLTPLVGLGAIITSAALMTKYTRFPGVAALPTVLGTVLIIAGGEASWLNRVVLSSRPFVLIGLTSYATYLWHWPLLAFLNLAQNGQAEAAVRLNVTAIAFLLGLCTYWLVEKPVRARQVSWRTTLASTLAMGVCVALASLALTTGGLPDRYPEWIQRLAAPSFSVSGDDVAGRCLVSTEQVTLRVPSADCIEPSRPLIVLWGDSHAAALSAGLRPLQATKTFGIGLLTAIKCPPLLGVADPSHPACAPFNAWAIETIRSAKPDTVILEAELFMSPWSPTAESEIPEGLARTVDALRVAGVGKIVLMGPPPHWQDRLARVVLSEWAGSRDSTSTFERLVPEDWPTMASADLRIRALAEHLGVEFFSVLQMLCTADGACLTRVGDGRYNIATVDGSHLTPSAANAVIRAADEQGHIFPGPK